jgi:hypothetical protein
MLYERYNVAFNAEIGPLSKNAPERLARWRWIISIASDEAGKLIKVIPSRQLGEEMLETVKRKERYNHLELTIHIPSGKHDFPSYEPINITAARYIVKSFTPVNLAITGTAIVMPQLIKNENDQTFELELRKLVHQAICDPLDPDFLRRDWP